jgi:DNA-binding FadR family transcriptional regulator
MSAANLDELRANVESIAAKIVALKKADPVDKEAIGAAVKDLIDAKRAFAQNNNGIGVDGKPFEEPMSKSDKKKAEKKKKEGTAVAESNKQVCASSYSN